jgi:uroporphyrin-III C-methyltransferase/precorrin-2 dehydrogenase/sirohydrochlorin ferrochelatase
MGKLAEFSGKWRKQVKEKISNPDERRIFKTLCKSPKRTSFNDNLEVANSMIEQALKVDT